MTTNLLKFLVPVGVLGYSIYKSVKTETKLKSKIDKMPIETYEDKIKKIQNELARIADLRLLNDKRESTNLIKTVEITIDGIPIDYLYDYLQEELKILYKQSNKKGSIF